MTAPRTEPTGWATEYHAPVMAAEVLGYLHGCRTVFDGTFGGGGHTAALLDAGADVLAADRDPDSIAAGAGRLGVAVRAGRLELLQENFADAVQPGALEARGTRLTRFEGVLLDLGVSSHQLDDPGRGFSFREGAPLDMRMGPGRDDAAALLNGADERVLADMFRRYADEPRSTRLAREIVRRRARRPFATSDDLVNAIRGALGPRTGPADFARLFQGVRIAVNDELASLAAALPWSRDRLLPGGTMVVIAYHSGEDRLVKTHFREWSAECVCPPRQLVCSCRGHPLGETLTRRPVVPAASEVEANPRARSARLRAWRRAP